MILSTILSVEAQEIATSKDLGTFGEVFPIKEKSLLEVIQAKLKALESSGTLKEHQQIVSMRTEEKMMRPEPVKDVRTTQEPRSFLYDPSITAPYDLKDHEGRVFHRAGTTVNPLDTHSWRCPFLFVDGDDPKQVAWAVKEHQQAALNHKPKIVLIKGAPFDLSKKLGLPVYFDQSGMLVKKFGITQAPARVSQKEKTLLIDEINLNGEPGLSRIREPK